MRDLQHDQENEELLYTTGGNPITKMSALNQQKEKELSNLREMYMATDQTVEDSFSYIEKVSFKMRKYNMTSVDVDSD